MHLNLGSLLEVCPTVEEEAKGKSDGLDRSSDEVQFAYLGVGF